jgi:hypothetical protein
MIIDRPIRFAGSAAEASANFNTHDFAWGDEDTRCVNCDCKTTHAAADYPCGTNPPRETITV